LTEYCWEDFDEHFEKGITDLTWTGEGSKDFLKEAVVEESHLLEIYNTFTSILEVITQKIDLWKKPVVFCKKW
jgi:hypothetical protein